MPPDPPLHTTCFTLVKLAVPKSPHPPAKILYETLQWQYTNNSPVGSTLLLIWYVTVSSAPELATILTEWFPGGLTSPFSTRGRVPVEEMNTFHKYHLKTIHLTSAQQNFSHRCRGPPLNEHCRDVCGSVPSHVISTSYIPLVLQDTPEMKRVGYSDTLLFILK